MLIRWSEMMQGIEIAQLPTDRLTENRAGILRSWIADRRVLAVVGLAVVGTGLALGWNWLTAVGIAPAIVSAAPCLIMCALGLCVIGRNHQACSNRPSPGAGEPPARKEPSAVASPLTSETGFTRRGGAD